MNDTIIESAGLYERGVFYFTNPTDQEFVVMWNSVEYTFPPKKTVPMLMNEAPTDIQEIRKRFAKKLHDREVMKSPEFLTAESKQQLTQSATTITNQKFIDSCLAPLPVADLKSEPVTIDSIDESGNTAAFEGNVEQIVPVLEAKKAKNSSKI